MSDISQIKISMPNPLYDLLNSKADRFGMTMSSYVKNLILNDVKDMEYPVFKMSETTEKAGLDAVKEYEAGSAILVDDIDKFFEDL